MTRTELIQNIINKYNYSNYLEIGCRNDENFNQIKIDNKIGVDPVSGGTLRMTSDEFFNQNNIKFDIIFIDGLHLKEQVDKDIENSIKFLSNNGTIVLHDCNPLNEDIQVREVQDEWTGDVWKSFVKCRSIKNIDCAVGDFDYGCGVIRIRKNSNILENLSESDLRWKNLDKNRNRWLNLKTYNNLIDWLDVGDFRITAVIPVLNRPQNVERLIKSYFENSPKDLVDMIFVANKDCVEEINEILKFSYLGNITLTIAPVGIISWAKKINWALKNFIVSNWILCGADDIVFHGGWFEFIMESARNFIGIIGTNDLCNSKVISGEHSTHPIVNIEYVEKYGTIDEMGKLLHEGYIHNFVDEELIATAKNRDCWKFCKACRIEHLHHAFGKSEFDNIYKIGNDSWYIDKALWENRSKLL